MSEPSDPAPPSIDDSLPPAPARVRLTLRDKLPEILIEAASVVVAILLAFAVDEWREARSRQALAERARDFIVAEIRANRDELRGTFDANRKTLEIMGQQMEALAKSADGSVSTGMNLSQLSAAAFDAAKATQAAQTLDFDWLVQVGRTYELQKQFQAAQDSALMDVTVAGGEISAGGNPRAVLQRLDSRLRAVQAIANGLLESYSRLLDGKP